MSDQPQPPSPDPGDSGAPPPSGAGSTPPPPPGGSGQSPPPPTSPQAGGPGAGQTGSPGSSTGLDTNIASLLAYLFGWVSGLIFFLIEKEDREVRFHAAQSIIVSIAFIAAWIVIVVVGLIPVIGFIVSILGWVVLGLGGLALWIYMLVQAYQGRHFKLPVAGDMAEQWAGGQAAA